MNIFGTVWNAIVAALAYMLQFIYDLVGNYGIAIILLTILVKLLLLPLTIKQTRSMLAMQRIQPEIKKLQEKYKDDREKLSQEMMKFYKENKINPLAGCLPLLMQMPIFIALYTVLRKYVMTPPIMLLGNVVKNGFASDLYNSGAVLVQGSLIRNASFLGINNLSDSLRVCGVAGYVLVILLMATTWYSQKQVVTDPRQKNIMMIMPLVMGFIGFTLPAGVVLYWVTTNALQILQQYGIQWWEKKEEAKAAEEAALLKEEARRTGKKLPEKEKGEEKPAGKAVEKTKKQEAQRALPGKKKPAQPDKQGAGKPDKPAPGQPKGSKQPGGGKPQTGGGQGGKGGGAPKGKPLPKQPPGGRRKPPPRKK